MKHFFLNLTNGIEFLKEEIDGQIHFVRVRSTTIERKDWLFLLMDLDYNFLLHLALGKECIFVDYGTNRKNSKTCYLGVPFIRYVLLRFLWGENDVKITRTSRNYNEEINDVQMLFENVYNDLFVFNATPEKNKLKKKLKYFKRFVSNETPLNLTYQCESTTMDGNYNYFVSLLKEKY